jgi:hypothetical protein
MTNSPDLRDYTIIVTYHHGTGVWHAHLQERPSIKVHGYSFISLRQRLEDALKLEAFAKEFLDASPSDVGGVDPNPASTE